VIVSGAACLSVLGSTVLADLAVTSMTAFGAVTIGGALTVGGSLTKGSGSFVIPHPDPEKRLAGKTFKHCFVESPTRGDKLYRFRGTTCDLRGRLGLPAHFWHLNEDALV
jgi:hypothetical protein